ncbi:hypothetical protein C427_1101 [Paraglaciecola psychrophila 170]|uniref:Uncharacterized protein n=1 Tax=Paraglaciecola psychrophila 170 TaxID=1129794 RepID=M4RI41_9ALTE|nr:hypothetical protein C427_1101 [Paraglaciecola psychrophila 170]
MPTLLFYSLRALLNTGVFGGFGGLAILARMGLRSTQAMHAKTALSSNKA